MSSTSILSEIYLAITTKPEILTPEFIAGLTDQVLPLAKSDADNKSVAKAINDLYKQFTKVRDSIKALVRKSLDDFESETTPGHETVPNHYPQINELEQILKERIDKQAQQDKQNPAIDLLQP